MYMKRAKSAQDIEMGPPDSSAVEEQSDGNLFFSDAEDEPWHSSSGSNRYAQHSSCASTHHLCTSSCLSDSSMEVDLESTISEVEENGVQKSERDCRICHLSLEIHSAEYSGSPIVLGCSCKDDLASAHKQCAETWFKIKGNKTCEICGSTAKNVAVNNEAESAKLPNETSSGTTSAAPPPPPPQAETSGLFWRGHNLLNFLLACMVFAFVISWFFHFNLPA